MMQDRNNDAIAAIVSDWIKENVKPR
jgi:hypothetical protein